MINKKIDKTITEKILYFLIIERVKKKIMYIATSIETLQIGALNE